MDEVFPVLAGVTVGLMLCGVRPGVLRACLLVTSALVLGATASWISGELRVSAWYLLIDCAQVLAAASATSLLASRWLRRRQVLR
jgi:hypothetical protein